MSDVKTTPATTDADHADQPTSWDEDYDNTKNEIVLVSSDNVGFRVDAWTFSKKSQFIKDLLDVPSDQKLDQAPIPLDCSADIARTFCDIIHTRAGAAVRTKCTVSDFEALFVLADRFEASAVAKAISEALQLRVDAHAPGQELDLWAIFKLAAKRDDYELARTTASGLVRTDEYFACNALQANPAELREVPASYFCALIRSIMQEKYYEPGTNYRDGRPYKHWVCDTDPKTVYLRFKLD